MTPFFTVLWTCFILLVIVASVSISLVFAQTTIAQNYSMFNNTAMQNMLKQFAKIPSEIKNLNNTVTIEECNKDRELYPTSHNMTLNIFGVVHSINPLDTALKACKEAGK